MTNVLDGGFVELIDHMGSDINIVNSARVSFSKRKDTFDKADEKLLKYLATHEHTSPYRHVYVTLHIKAPETVARQWYKHIVGSEYAFKDQPWNEMSGRYVKYNLGIHEPKHFRKQSKDVKQGSHGVVDDNLKASTIYKEAARIAMAAYEELLELGVCKEQARMILPVATYTEWYWTASLQALQHFVKLRAKPDAQYEIRVYAEAIDEIMTKLYPHAWRALNEQS